jgi:transcriptional regulator with XRE-family HTH domain
MEATGSTVPRRQLGRYLRELRNRRCMTVKRAAEEMEWSETKIWRIENGMTSLRSHDVETLCRIYAAPPDLSEALKALAKETKAKGWWHDYGDVIPEWLDMYIGLEEAASQLCAYQPELVPGLLQTEQYARSVIKEDNPGVDDREIDRRVHVRIARQMLVRREADPLELHVALNEAILHRPVGGPDVMAAQLDALAEAADIRNVKLRVVPYAAGLHHGVMTGPFVILRFPVNGNGAESEPATVYVEGFTGALYLDKPREVTRYTVAFDRIWDAALDEPASTDLIHRSAEELRE